MADRRALPGTVVPWSPDFPPAYAKTSAGKRMRLPAVALAKAGGRPALWRWHYGLLGTRQQERQQFGPAFAVDDPINEVRPEPALERDHRLLLISHIIAEALQRQ